MKKLIHFYKLVWKVSPSYLLLLVGKAFFACGKVMFNIILPKCIVDELLGAREPQTLLLFGILIVANNVGLEWVEKSFDAILEGKGTYTNHAMNKAMAEKIMNLEYSYLEDPYYLDLKERAIFAISNQGAVSNMIMSTARAFSNFFVLMGLISILVTLGPVLIIVLIIGIVLMLLVYGGASKYQVQLQNEIIPINRRFGYYLGLGFEKQYQKDVRLYNMEDMITNRAFDYLEETCDKFEKVFNAMGKALAGMNVVKDGMAAFCYVYVGLRTISNTFGKQISLGSLTMYVTSAINFSNVVRELGENVVMIMQFLSYLDPYLEFMMLEEETKEKGNTVFEGQVETIEFENVTFSYPKSEKQVLKNVSFKINRGEKISVVGLNGAGKTTLVKLLCRMYPVDSGVIKINGKNIYDYDYLSYMKCIAAVFQDYKLFNFSIAENISCREKDADMVEIERLIDEVGMADKIEELADGVHSRFGKDYDENGVEFSGGQSQKIAIARALYKESSMVILDEPASALDPIAEAEIYEKFNGLVEDKTAIYISHRMSSSVFCDKILIINGGKVEDYDTHENLMKKTESLYYKLFMSQAQNYRLEEA